MTAALAARGLTVRRGGFALGPLELTVGEREAVLVLGPSLAGKSTLLKALAGLLPSAGELALGGTPLWARGSVRIEAQRQMGVVFQSEALFDSLSVLENVALPLRRRGASREVATERARACLREVSLSEAEAKLPEQLSGGMRKRVALARALAPRSPVLLIDDPLAGLDPGTTTRIAALLSQVRDEGHALVVFTADPTPLWSLATAALALDDGRVVAAGAPALVRERSALLQAAS